MSRPELKRLDLFVGIALLSVAICWLWKPIRASNDLWWHLATGRYLTETKTLPLQDVFSWTHPDRAWTNHEWLFDLVLFGVHQLGGVSGLLAFKVLLILGAFLLLWRSLRDGEVPWGLRVLVSGLAFWASRYAWNLRADLVSLFLIFYLASTLRALGRGESSRSLLLWPLLYVLWANLHGGFVLGLVLIGAYGAGLAWERRLTRRFVSFFALCAAATLVNPWGWKLHFSIAKAIAVLQQAAISEWSAPPWNPLQLFWICLGLYWITWAWRLYKRRTFNAPEFLMGAVLSLTAARNVRNVPLFMGVAFPWVGWAWVESFVHPQVLNRSVWKALALVVSAVLIALWGPRMQGGIDENVYPVEACQFIDQENLPARFFNDYAFGGYWMWHFGTRRPVFIDGRYHAVEGYPELFKALETARASEPLIWQAFLREWNVEAALIGYARSAAFPSVGHFYFPREYWALVYWDDAAMIYVRRMPAFEKWIKKWEFSAIDPDVQEDFFREWLQRNPLQHARVENDLQRNLEQHPQSVRTQRLLALLHDVKNPA